MVASRQTNPGSVFAPSPLYSGERGGGRGRADCRCAASPSKIGEGRASYPSQKQRHTNRSCRVMLAKLSAFALVGIDAVPVEVEVDAAAGLPKIILVGL